MPDLPAINCAPAVLSYRSASLSGMDYRNVMQMPEVGVPGESALTDLPRHDLHEHSIPSFSLRVSPSTESFRTTFISRTPPVDGGRVLLKNSDTSSKLQRDSFYEPTIDGDSRFFHQLTGGVHVSLETQVPQVREITLDSTILGEADASESFPPSFDNTLGTHKPSDLGTYEGQNHTYPSSRLSPTLHDRSFDAGREEGSTPTNQAIAEDFGTRNVIARHDLKGSTSAKSRDARPKVLPQDTTTCTICARTLGKAPSCVIGVGEPSALEVTSAATNAGIGSNPASLPIGVRPEHTNFNHRRPGYIVELSGPGHMSS
ncbi:hypothetical protein PM082_005120 [Marasmius tenuissimus]|nr:hypothetical protein PM082_005120 [Marasmius tenuissimus]